MAFSNFILTVTGVTAVVLVLRSDVKQSAAIFRRNVRHILNWLEEESSVAAKEVEKATKPKEIQGKERLLQGGQTLDPIHVLANCVIMRFLLYNPCYMQCSWNFMNFLLLLTFFVLLHGYLDICLIVYL